MSQTERTAQIFGLLPKKGVPNPRKVLLETNPPVVCPRNGFCRLEKSSVRRGFERRELRRILGRGGEAEVSGPGLMATFRKQAVGTTSVNSLSLSLCLCVCVSVFVCLCVFCVYVSVLGPFWGSPMLTCYREVDPEDWLAQTIHALKDQLDHFEADTEMLQSKMLGNGLRRMSSGSPRRVLANGF